MTVEALWEEVKALAGKQPTQSDRLQPVLVELVSTPQGRMRLLQEVEQDQKLQWRKAVLLRQIAKLLESKEDPSSSLGQKDRSELLERSIKAARKEWRIEVAYWMFLWLRLKSGQTSVASEVAREFRALNDRHQSAKEFATRLITMQGYADFPMDRWADLLESAIDAELSPENRSQLQKVLEVIKSGNSQPLPKSVVSSPSAQVKAVEAKQATTVEPRVTEARPIVPATLEAGAATVEGGRVQTQTRKEQSKTSPPTQTQNGNPSEPKSAPAVETGSGKPQTSEPLAAHEPRATSPSSKDEAVNDQGQHSEANEAKEVRPKKPSTRKTAVKDVANLANSGKVDGSLVSGNSEATVLGDLVSAVQAISGRLEQIASRSGDGVSLSQRLEGLERRLAGVERALTDSQMNAQRSNEVAEGLRSQIRQREQEVEDANRQRDVAMARADDLARRLSSADARIDAAEKRADQNIHEAFRERDAAVLTFKARLWDAVQAQLSDVTDPVPGEEFVSTEEEVLTTRLRSIRDTLRAEGVPP